MYKVSGGTPLYRFVIELCALLDKVAHVSNMNSDLINCIRYSLDGQSIIEVFCSYRVYCEDSFLSQIESLGDLLFWNDPLFGFWVDVFGKHLETLMDVGGRLLILVLVGLCAYVMHSKQSHTLCVKVAGFSDGLYNLALWLLLTDRPAQEFRNIVSLSNLLALLLILFVFFGQLLYF